jgi:hypothetical protein
MLNQPKFRLSCRAADWLALRDLNALRDVVPSTEKIEVLQLNPLDDNEILTLLRHCGEADPRQFQLKAVRRNLHELLRNPLLLKLLFEAVGAELFLTLKKRSVGLKFFNIAKHHDFICAH